MGAWFQPHSAPDGYFCVVGNPIAHSLSPRIHNAFASEFGLSLIYERVRVEAGSLAAAVAEFRDSGGRGLNVTVPLKGEAAKLADNRSASVAVSEAANTLWFDTDGRVCADNTDGIGLVRDLSHNHDIELGDADILLLGAGGAARGVLPALLEQRPRRLWLSNRTAATAHELAQRFPDSVTCVAWGADPPAPPDLIINATSLGLSGNIPPLGAAALHPDCVCYDMVYAAEPTAFVAHARAAGVARAYDGLGMLVEQAAAAFFIWHGVSPATAAVISALRA